ncbi:hypothetical protein Nlim_1379 [Candidatus Nitrosarchaeum limnium SFB1]|jgi:hypothetical protein|uniref:Transcriptional regulator n=1 Tax=Candidatus Nitrosarchaeum limnium SFB1 TaxID=886738 RepID=F3KLJ8_9ARCH|nr:hypothetical protein Nlim_1379 [Candidatus Nitrosarchaeum limnium SFB1]
MTMTGIDRLISTSLSEIIKKKLEKDDLKNLERTLFLKHGMSIKLSIEHFQNFTKILKSVINVNEKKFVSECICGIIKIKKTDSGYKIRIIEEELIDLILQVCGDSETRKIIGCVFSKELTIPQILNECKVPKTSGYRKIENLIINGFILETGKVLSESKRISKYRCVFDEIKIEMQKNNVIIHGIINNKIFDKSTSMALIH